MARLNTTPAKQTTARKLTKLSDKKEPHTPVRRIFKEWSPTEAEEDREEQWRIATDAWAKDKSYGFGGRPPLGRNRSQREKKATLATNFNILPDSDGTSDVDQGYRSSTSSARKEVIEPTVPLKQAHINSLLLPLAQQPRNRPTQKLETYDYAKENDPIDGEEEENAPTISRHSSNASSRYSPTRRNARQDMEVKEGNLRFLSYRQSQESNSEDEGGDNSFSSLDGFIVSDNEELSYYETTADELEEEDSPTRISPPRPRRRLLRGRRPNPEAELKEALMNPSYKNDLCLEPSLPPSMTIQSPQPKPKPERAHVKNSQMTKNMKMLNLGDPDTDSQLQRDSTSADTDSPTKKSETSLAVLDTPPPSHSKGPLRSPTKGRICIQPTPYRESVDAFWSQDVTNDWIDQHSPQKEEKKLEQYLREFEESDGDTNSENMRRPRERHRAPKTPSKTALKREETEKKKSALVRKKSFDNKKAQIADEFLKILDEAVSGGQIQKLAEETGGVRIIWSKNLLTTAGRANWKREKIGKESRISESGSEPSTLIKQHATIELAERIIDSEDRLINTVAHEYCHLANYMISNIHNNPHGASFKLWGRKCKEALKNHPVYGGRVEVTTKHSYQIDYKYVWSCVDCGQNYGRHSKSIDTAKSRCGACKGLLQQIKPKPRNVSPRKKQSTPPSERCEKKSVEDMAKVFGEVSLYSSRAEVEV
ncbi:hypothetical protein KXV60_001154 [Aspergillus fumigatus]|nr:hypothetical protein KXV60_001154 [Aspergillus fumigatus]